MKNVKKVIFTMLITVIIIVSCQDDPKFGSAPQSSELKFSVAQQSGFDNKVFLENQTPGTIPLWDYGSGRSTRQQDTVIYPFQGDYWIKFTAFGSGGASATDSVKVTVTEFCGSCISDPNLITLTNRTAGKTWVFDTTSPLGYYGTGFLTHTGDSNDWSYFPTDCPSWNGFQCDQDWGSMTFDLNGAFNYKVTQKSLTDGNYTTTSGQFSYNTSTGTMKFVGAKMLWSGNYNDVADWNDAYVYGLNDSTLYLTVIRTSDNTPLRFKYIVKK
jgi:hypothetical protein